MPIYKSLTIFLNVQDQDTSQLNKNGIPDSSSFGGSMNCPPNGKDMERREFFNGFQQPFGHRLHSALFPSGLYEDIKFQKRRLLSKGVCRRHETKRWENNLNNQDTKPNMESCRAAELAYLNEAGCFYTSGAPCLFLA